MRISDWSSDVCSSDLTKLVTAAAWSNFSAQIEVSTPRNDRNSDPRKPNHRNAHRWCGVTSMPGHSALPSPTAPPTPQQRVTATPASPASNPAVATGGRREPQIAPSLLPTHSEERALAHAHRTDNPRGGKE